MAAIPIAVVLKVCTDDSARADGVAPIPRDETKPQTVRCQVDIPLGDTAGLYSESGRLRDLQPGQTVEADAWAEYDDGRGATRKWLRLPSEGGWASDKKLECDGMPQRRVGPKCLTHEPPYEIAFGPPKGVFFGNQRCTLVDGRAPFVNVFQCRHSANGRLEVEFAGTRKPCSEFEQGH